MHKLGCFQFSAAVLAFAALVQQAAIDRHAWQIFQSYLP
jgi:hypothetical protein